MSSSNNKLTHGRLKSAYNRTGSGNKKQVFGVLELAIEENRFFNMTLTPIIKQQGEGAAVAITVGPKPAQLIKVFYQFHNEKVHFRLIRNPATLTGLSPINKSWANDAAVVAGMPAGINTMVEQLDDITLAGGHLVGGVALDSFYVVGADEGGAAIPFIEGDFDANKVLAANTTYVLEMEFEGITTGEMHVIIAMIDEV